MPIEKLDLHCKLLTNQKQHERDMNVLSSRAKRITYCFIIIGLLAGCGNENVTDNAVNHPPNIPSNPSPSSGATNVETDPQLTWQCSDPDNDLLTYDIYFGAWPDLSLSDSNLTQATYSPGPLQERVTYCWKIIAKDIYNDTTAGPKWHFSTTYGNLPPDIPYNPYPDSGATNQEIDLQLSWQCSDPENDILTYDIYFGTSPSPPLYDSNLVFNSYSVGPLQYETTFYWKVIAYDGHQHQTEGPIWSFSTRLEPDTVYFIGSYDTPGEAKAVFVSDIYAYVADALYGLQIINVSNPSSPSLVGSYDTPGFAVGVFVSGDYSYVADGASGLQIIDILDPENPSYAGSYNTPGYAYDVFVFDSLAYMADGAYGLQIIDVSDPSSPSLVGNYNTPAEGQGIFVAGNYTYIADGTSGLHIVNTLNPGSPSYAGSYDTPGESQGVFISGNYAYVADGLIGGLQVIDVTNPSGPTYESSYNTPGSAWDVYVSGIHVYVADYNGGLQILNVAVPASPELVANYATAGYAYGVFVLGGYIYVACHDAGLQILQFQ